MFDNYDESLEILTIFTIDNLRKIKVVIRVLSLKLTF